MSSKSPNARKTAPQVQTLKQRAAQARDAVGHVIERVASQVTDQPEAASLPAGSAAERGDAAFSANGHVSHDAGGGHPAASGRAPHREHEMGRHETFETATPIADELLTGTIFGRAPAAALPEPGSDEAVAAFEAACREFTRLTPLSDEDYAALRIGDTFTLWTTGWIKAARRGDYARFSLREFEIARSKTPAELSALLVLTTRRDLQFAEAEQRTQIKTLYALAYPDGEDPEPLPDPEGDHAHVAIAEHREAYAEWKPLGDAWSDAEDQDACDAAERAQAEPHRIQAEAFQELIDTRASTVAGLVALAAYLPGAVIDANCVEVEEDARRALRSICTSVLRLFGDEADAALVTLEADYLAADAAYTVAANAMREGRKRYAEPPVPRDLKVWSNDWAYTSIPMPQARRDRFHYDEFEVEILRTQPCVATFIGGEGELQPDGVGRVRPDPRAQARADAIVAAWDGWQEQIRQARAAVDLDALEAAWDAATAARDAVLQRVRETTARGLTGLAVKARIIASMAAVNDPKAHARESFDPDDSDGLLYDLAGDVLAATGGLPEAYQISD